MKRRIALLLLVSLLLPMLGCGNSIDNSGYVATGDAILMEGQEPEDIEPEKENTQELTLAYYPDRSLNPLFGSDYTNRVLMSLMYQPLFAVDNQKNATPILCGAYKISQDYRTWIFYVDENARFSDGTRVTAEDVLATYQQAKKNDYYKNRFYHVFNLSLTEDGTGVIFGLDTRYQNLPLLLDVPIVKASEVEAELPAGTGPYVFMRTASGAHLQRDHNWWCGETKVPATDESISLVEVTSVGEVRDQFQFGDVSVVCTNPMSDSFAEYRCDYELWQIESGYMLYIGCNVQWSDFFAKNGGIRTFLTYGLDRESLAQHAYKGRVNTVTIPCSPGEVFYSKTLASKYEYNPMEFVGHMGSYTIPTKDNVKKTLTLAVNSDDSARVKIARDIAEDLTDLGLACETKEYSGSVFKNVLIAQNFDIYLGMTRLSPTMDLTEFFRVYGELSYGGIANETLLSMTTNALENNGNFYNLYQKLAEDGRIIPLMFGYYAVYAQRGICPDLNPARDNVFYYTLEKTMKDILIENVE